MISPYISKTFYGWMPYFVIMSQCDPTFDPKINVGHSDLCFMVQWFCIYILKTIWWMNVKLWHNYSVWHNIWPKCRSQWPIFLGPVILSYFLKTLIYMNIVLCYNEPVWHNLWPLNRSYWPLFHGPLILPNILGTIWWMLYSFKEAIYNHI